VRGRQTEWDTCCSGPSHDWRGAYSCSHLEGAAVPTLYGKSRCCRHSCGCCRCCFWCRGRQPRSTAAGEEQSAADGLGLLIGDGALNYREEKIIEAYYAYKIDKTSTLTADYQFIDNPAYNADRGPAHVFTGRFHAEF
jgi:hypothetical protein